MTNTNITATTLTLPAAIEATTSESIYVTEFNRGFEATFSGFYAYVARPTLRRLADTEAEFSKLLLAFIECCGRSAQFNQATAVAADAAGADYRARLHAIQHALAGIKLAFNDEFGLNVKQTMAIFDLAESIVESDMESVDMSEPTPAPARTQEPAIDPRTSLPIAVSGNTLCYFTDTAESDMDVLRDMLETYIDVRLHIKGYAQQHHEDVEMPMATVNKEYLAGLLTLDEVKEKWHKLDDAFRTDLAKSMVFSYGLDEQHANAVLHAVNMETGVFFTKDYDCLRDLFERGFDSDVDEYYREDEDEGEAPFDYGIFGREVFDVIASLSHELVLDEYPWCL